MVTKNIRNASLLLALYLLLTVAVRALLPWSLLLDEAEQSFLSQFMLAGYGPQPPFYNWIQAIVVSIIGLSMWSLSGTKFAMLFICYILYGLAAYEVLRSRSLAAFAMLSLLTLPQISYMPQQDLTHTVAVLTATSLLFYGVFRTLMRPSLLSYLLIGIASGIGVICKYNFAILPIAICLALLFDSNWRRKLLDWRMLPAIGVALVIVAPHAIWLIGNFDSASAQTLGKMELDKSLNLFEQTIRGIVSLLRATLAYCALTVVIFLLAFRRDSLAIMRASDQLTRLIERIVLISLLMIVAIIMITGATHITERWLNPFLVIVPLYLFAKMRAANIDLSAGLRRLRPVFPVLMIITLIPLAARSVIVARYTGDYTNINLPMADLVKQLTSKQMPGSVITEDVHLAGNIHMQLPKLPVRTAGPIGSDVPLNYPILVVWKPRSESDKAIPRWLAQVVPEVSVPNPVVETVEAPYNFGRDSDRYRLNYVWLHKDD
ncbi:glycosyltransferase family 39 protein [Rhizobium sp. S152]|uniref:glycosyltransferase family 39 protein n=1 Tax=Rhizobium sp. S152 TaxID=3055038 RepID=UPI0025A98413|nr:glycosyltransferase family 39 protein [Rhizobium sp. S152]MDM9629309.1 glycosyltransferase family 39 protein [Rhizobium sp. S152]